MFRSKTKMRLDALEATVRELSNKVACMRGYHCWKYQHYTDVIECRHCLLPKETYDAKHYDKS